MKTIIGSILFVCATSANAISIDTTSLADSSVNAFGNPNTATYGQTINLGSNAGILNSFSFFLGPLDQSFKAYVYQWDGLKATGSALFESEAINIGSSFSGFAEVLVNTGEVNLNANTDYALFFSTSGLQNVQSVNFWQHSYSDIYSMGRFIFINNGNNFDLITTQYWDNFVTGDLAFKANISDINTVPVPAAAWLFGSALIGFAGFRRRV